MLLPLVALLAAAPAAGLVVRPAQARPGDAVLLVVTGALGEPSATVEGRPLRFWRTASGWRALASLSIEAPAGPLPVTVRAGGEQLAGTITVVDPAFPARELTVPPRFVAPPPAVRRRIEADQRAFAAAFDRAFAPPRFEAPFERPVAAEPTGRYGDRRTFNGRQQSQHYGLDLDAATGTPALASNDGVVVLTRDTYYAGNAVVVWHGAELFTAYFHLSRIDVKVGQAVARGERLGLTGASGRATGPHLHWGVKLAGRWVDPESVVRLGAFARE